MTAIFYERLRIPQNASIEHMEKSYKSLMYAYTREGNKTGIIDLNEAYNTLKDPYKRQFYDRFGDECGDLLSNTAHSFLFTRFCTTANLYLLILYAYMIMANFFFLGLIYKIPTEHPFLRYLAFIIGPAALFIVFINTARHFERNDIAIARLGLGTFLAVANSISMVITLTRLSVWYFIVVELIVNAYVFIHLRRDPESSYRIQGFVLIKGVFMCCHYLEYDSIKYFIPCAIALAISIFYVPIGIILSIAIFPMCLSIFLSMETSYKWTANILHALHIICGCCSLYIFTSFIYKLLVRRKFTFQLSLGAAEVHCIV